MTIHAGLYRLFGIAGGIALTTNVYKHGWHPVSIATGLVFTGLMFSLGTAPEQRTIGWEVRYLIATVGVLGLAAYRFL